MVWPGRHDAVPPADEIGLEFDAIELSVQRRPEVVAVSFLSVAGVDVHPHLDVWSRPSGVEEPELDVEGSVGGVVGGGAGVLVASLDTSRMIWSFKRIAFG